MQKKLLKIVLHIAGVMLFIFATAYALLAAYGYQIDLLHQNIVKTSIIDVSNELEDVEIYFDGDLVAKKAPFQIKNVKPGIHELKILKTDFTSWVEKVTVIEDVVTKLDDILLIPLDLEKYKEILEFGLIYDEVLINKNYFLLISRETNKIYINKIGNKNINFVDTINLELEDAEISFIDMHRLQINYIDNLNVIDLRNSSSLNVIIPDEFNSFKIAYTPYLSGYYLNDGEVYSVDISEEGTFQEIKMFDKEDELLFEELNVISSYDHILITCDSNLYLIENDNLILIDENIVGLPSISSDGVKIIYMNDGNEIYLYNIYDKEKELLGRFINHIESLKWHKDSMHLYLMQNENLLICDLEFSNCKKLLSITKSDNFTNNSERSQFIFVKEDTFEVYNLDKII